MAFPYQRCLSRWVSNDGRLLSLRGERSGSHCATSLSLLESDLWYGDPRAWQKRTAERLTIARSFRKPARSRGGSYLSLDFGDLRAPRPAQELETSRYGGDGGRASIARLPQRRRVGCVSQLYLAIFPSPHSVHFTPLHFTLRAPPSLLPHQVPLI